MSRERIKTHFARIVVGTGGEKPYYSILYFDPEDLEYHIGYGSFYLENVKTWLAEEFDVSSDSSPNEPVRYGKWEFAGDGVVSCTVCKEAYNNVMLPRNFCPNCGSRMFGKSGDNI